MLVMDQANKNFKNPRVGLSGGGDVMRETAESQLVW